MVFVFEMDLTRRKGKLFNWNPCLFKGKWECNKTTWRLGWGIWSISYYPSKSLRAFFEYVPKVGWHGKRVNCNARTTA